MTNTPEDSDKQQLTLVENRKIQQNALLKIQKYQNKQKNPGTNSTDQNSNNVTASDSQR